MIAVACSIALLATPAFARRTVGPIYEDSFDIAGGGASLTRASRDGRLFSNPALLPLGASWHRWFGTSLSVLYSAGAKELVGGMAKGSSGGDANNAAGDLIAGAVDNREAHFGTQFSLSWLTRDFGLSLFLRAEPDVELRQVGDYGAPAFRVGLEAYSGAVVAIPLPIPVRWFKLGLAGKYVIEEDAVQTVNIGAGNDKMQEDIAALSSAAVPRAGTGVDVGTLFFFQGSNVDFSVAGKIDDLGSTKLTPLKAVAESTADDEAAADAPGATAFKQTTNAGLGLTFHTGGDMIHFAVDYRDLAKAYPEERLFKRVYAGTKITVRGHLGLAAGIYHGKPSYGAEIDLFFLRLALTRFTREVGSYQGEAPREITMATLSMGF